MRPLQNGTDPLFRLFERKRLAFDLPNSRGVRRVSKQAFFLENPEKSDVGPFRNGLTMFCATSLAISELHCRSAL